MAPRLIVRRSAATLCACGGDVFSRTVDDAGAPAWECTNCMRVTPRRRRHSPTNRGRALTAWRVLSAEWEPITADLDGLITAGAVASGAYLVHTATYNYHMRQLADLEAPSRFQVRYHAAQARLDLIAARAWVDTKKGEPR